MPNSRQTTVENNANNAKSWNSCVNNSIILICYKVHANTLNQLLPILTLHHESSFDLLFWSLNSGSLPPGKQLSGDLHRRPDRRGMHRLHLQHQQRGMLSRGIQLQRRLQRGSLELGMCGWRYHFDAAHRKWRSVDVSLGKGQKSVVHLQIDYSFDC